MIFKKKRMPNRRIWLNLLEKERGKAEADRFIKRVQKKYRELLNKQDRFPNRALQKMHLETNILPVLALYRELLKDGMNREDAVAKTGEYLDVVAGKLRRRFQLTARMPFFFTFLKKMMRPSMERNFPVPGFELEWPELGEDATGFNVQRCFYVDLLGTFGAPELTRLFCDMDDVVFEKTPGVRWERKDTIGRGGTHCDFRYYKDKS